MGAQKNCLNEMVLLSTHNIYFGREIRKLIFNNALNISRPEAYEVCISFIKFVKICFASIVHVSYTVVLYACFIFYATFMFYFNMYCKLLHAH